MSRAVDNIRIFDTILIEPKMIGYFGYCRTPLKTEKIIILPIFFCRSGGYGVIEQFVLNLQGSTHCYL